jgi:hypothetical protein
LVVSENDSALEEQRDRLVSAAHVAASWAHARRTKWTSVPLNLAIASPAVPAADIITASAPVEVPRTVETVPQGPAKALPAPSPFGQAAWAALTRALEQNRPLLKWLALGAAAAVILGAAVAGGRYLWESLPPRPAVRASAGNASKPALATAAAKTAQGSLRVSSTPVGAQVLVDGKPRGVTPLNLTDLSVGHHEVELKGEGGTVRRAVTISPTAPATIDEAIFAGFVKVYAPFDVTIAENGRVLRADDSHQIMLPAGAHQLRLTNRALGYDAVRAVDVKPGEATALQLAPDPSTLTVTAAEAAEVWLDGTRIGDAPVNAAPVPLGVHEVLVKRAAGGERRFTVTIGAKPFTLNVTF